MPSRSLYLAAYDVTDDNRRRRVLKAVRRYSSGGQKSALECWLTAPDIRALIADVRDELDPDEDRFGLLPLDPRRGVFTLGRALQPSDPDFLYFG